MMLRTLYFLSIPERFHKKLAMLILSRRYVNFV